MGIEYDLVSDSKKEAFVLGKGPWSKLVHEYWANEKLNSLNDCVLAVFDVVKHFAFRDFNEGFEYVHWLAGEIWKFISEHPDWELVDDASCDYDVTDDGKSDYPDFPADWPIYKKVGSRYRE